MAHLLDKSIDTEYSVASEAPNISNASTCSNLPYDVSEVQRCMQLFSQNKISVGNVWDMKLIDNINRLIWRPHEEVNFRTFPSTVDAMSHIYGVRVDCIHRMTLHLASNTCPGRKSICKQHQIHSSADEDGDESDELNSSKEIATTQRRRNRRITSTITSNKQTLNGRLELCPTIDPVLVLWNRIPGDICQPHKMFMNILSTRESDLKLDLSEKFWDSNPTLMLQNDSCDVEDTFEIDLFNIDATHTLRQHPLISGYKISNDPNINIAEMQNPLFACIAMESVPPENMALAVDQNEIRDLFAFDVNDNDMNLDNLNPTLPEAPPEDESDLEYIPNLIAAESNAVPLEYSYTNLINPLRRTSNHWKHKRTNFASSNNSKQRCELPNLDYEPDDSNFISIHNNIKVKIRQVRSNLWAPEKNLHCKFNINPNIFDSNRVATPNSAGQENVAADNNAVIEYVSENNNSVGHGMIMDVDDEFDSDSYSSSIETQPLQPVFVTKYAHYPMYAKFIDMKQLKRRTLHLIDAALQEKPEITFAFIYAQLPSVLTPHMARNLSHSICFYTILHLANEYGFQLKDVTANRLSFTIMPPIGRQ